MELTATEEEEEIQGETMVYDDEDEARLQDEEAEAADDDDDDYNSKASYTYDETSGSIKNSASSEFGTPKTPGTFITPASFIQATFPPLASSSHDDDDDDDDGSSAAASLAMLSSSALATERGSLSPGGGSTPRARPAVKKERYVLNGTLATHVIRLNHSCHSQNRGAVLNSNDPTLQIRISKYKGVCWVRQRQKWEVHIYLHGKKRHVGYFDDEVIAARAYDKAVTETCGSKAITNFDPVTGEVREWLVL